MIDLHSHILPGLDDGCKTVKQALEMARIYEETGFNIVVATPHYVQGTAWCPDPIAILRQVDKFNRILLQYKINVHVMGGMEIGIDPVILDNLLKKKLLTLGSSSYVLIEAPFQQLPIGWDHVLFDILSNGYQVILAHPERCDQIIRQPAILQKITSLGCLIQIDWGSLLGHHGPQSARFTKKILSSGFVHCLATDSHDSHYRSPKIVDKGIERLKKIIGDEQAHILTIENPDRILKSKAINPFEQKKTIRKRGIIQRLFSWG